MVDAAKELRTTKRTYHSQGFKNQPIVAYRPVQTGFFATPVRNFAYTAIAKIVTLQTCRRYISARNGISEANRAGSRMNNCKF